MVATPFLVAPSQILGLIRILLDPSVTVLEHLHISFLTRRQTKDRPRVGVICTEADLTTLPTLHHRIQLHGYRPTPVALLLPRGPNLIVTQREDDIMSCRSAARFNPSFFHCYSGRRRGALCSPSLLLCSVPFLSYRQSLLHSLFAVSGNFNYQYAGIFEANSTCCPIWALQFFFGGVYTSR